MIHDVTAPKCDDVVYDKQGEPVQCCNFAGYRVITEANDGSTYACSEHLTQAISDLGGRVSVWEI